MTTSRAVRLSLVAILLAGAMIWVFRTNLQPAKATLIVTAVIGALTAIYALFTYEILLQNQSMASAALESAKLMERSLRFSHAPALVFSTISTKDPDVTRLNRALIPIRNDDYKRAVSTYRESGGQCEFVFAILENKGLGAATHVSLNVVYQITDGSSLNKESTVTKSESFPIIDSMTGVALCIFISRIPTPEDKVTLVSAKVVSGDHYRDAIQEKASEIEVLPASHFTERSEDCVIRLA